MGDFNCFSSPFLNYLHNFIQQMFHYLTENKASLGQIYLEKNGKRIASLSDVL